MRKISHLIVIFALAVLLFGCTTDGGGTPSQHYKYTGSNAIEVRFSPEAPSSAENYYYVDESIPVEIEVKNLGYNKIKKGDIKAKLVGVVATKDFSGKKGPISPDGDVMPVDIYGESVPSYFDFGSLKYVRDLVETSYKTKMEADICYDYLTSSLLDLFVTLRPDEMGGVSIKSGDNPAAPIQIKNLKQTVGPEDQIAFDFEVVNVGDGRVVDTCFEKYERGKQYDEVVKVELERDVHCNRLGGNKGEIKLREGVARLYCKLPVDTSNVGYSVPIRVDIEYTYQEHIETPIVINKEPE